MHRLASTGFRLPSASFSVLKVSLAPLGKGTVVTARRFGKLLGSWQVAHWNPLEMGWATMPVIWTPDGVTTNVQLLARYSGRPVALWHLAQPAGTTPVPSPSQWRNGSVLPAK